jgi:hypothetical protein
MEKTNSYFGNQFLGSNLRKERGFVEGNKKSTQELEELSREQLPFNLMSYVE